MDQIEQALLEAEALLQAAQVAPQDKLEQLIILKEKVDKLLIDESQKLTFGVESLGTGTLVANWFKLKARVDDSEATTKELKKSADYLEDMIVQKMEEQELDKVSTKLGSVTLKQKSMPSVKDIVSFIKWVSEDVDNRVGFIQKRVNEAAINEMLENEGMLPPGVDTYIKPKLNKRSAK